MSTYKPQGKHISVGLDIGTTKIVALVAAPDPLKRTMKVLGFGIAESEGLNRGVVVNIDKTVKTIKKVIEQAEQQSGIKITDVSVGIAGDHIENTKTRSIIGISNPNHEINQSDVKRLLDDASKMPIAPERRIIHVLPQEFMIDGQDGITDPIGMSGVRLEADVNIITGLATAIQNIHRCVERVGLNIKNVVLEPIASSKAVLTDEELEVGVALVDIGGGTTDVAIFTDGIIRYTSVFAIAGKHVTADIRSGLGVIAKQAEQIKRDYGHCYRDGIMKDDVFMIPGIGGRKPMEARKSELCAIVQPRMEEIFEFALSEIRSSGYLSSLGAGVVITGGTTLLRGTEELAREVFGMPVKIGIPTNLSFEGLATEVESPVYATSVGLALIDMGNFDNIDLDAYAKEQQEEEKLDLQSSLNVQRTNQPAINDDDDEEEEFINDESDEEDGTDEEQEKLKQKKEKDNKNKVSIATRLKKFIEEL